MPRDDIVLRHFVEGVGEVLGVHVVFSAGPAFERAGSYDGPVGAVAVPSCRSDVRLVLSKGLLVGIVPDLGIGGFSRGGDEDAHSRSVEVATHGHDAFHFGGFCGIE